MTSARIPLFPSHTGVLISRPLGKDNNIDNNTGGRRGERKADNVSLQGKRATCAEHFIASHGLFTLRKSNLEKE